MLLQVIQTPVMLFMAGFSAGFIVCWLTRPVRPSSLVVIPEDIAMSVQREFAKMAW